MARISMYTGASKKFNSNLRYAFMVIKSLSPNPSPKGRGVDRQVYEFFSL